VAKAHRHKAERLTPATRQHEALWQNRVVSLFFPTLCLWRSVPLCLPVTKLKHYIF